LKGFFRPPPTPIDSIPLNIKNLAMSNSQAALAAQQKEMSRKLEEYIEK
jgi:hypothetical protein